jgi:hypothetical protein
VWEQAREDKALMAKALSELQKQMDMLKKEKDETVQTAAADLKHFSEENGKLKQHIANAAPYGDSGDSYELERLQKEVTTPETFVLLHTVH